ncbi:MAG: cytochrome c oxidase subunit 4, partial [Actinomycetota bacterium]|nr:cytochrome c oxidase subunit 4 [Actinomycetota bacterium]
FWNMFATIGSFIIGLGVLIFLFNVWVSARAAKDAPPVGPDPWDARSLEWFTPNPTPVHNFDADIQVDALDEFWHRKYGQDEAGRVVRVATAEEVCQDGSATDTHLPSPSYWPIVLAAGLPFVAFGLMYSLWFCVPGGALVLMAIYGWIFEPTDDPDGPHGHGHHDDHDDDGAADEAATEDAEEAPVG